MLGRISIGQICGWDVRLRACVSTQCCAYVGAAKCRGRIPGARARGWLAGRRLRCGERARAAYIRPRGAYSARTNVRIRRIRRGPSARMSYSYPRAGPTFPTQHQFAAWRGHPRPGSASRSAGAAAAAAPDPYGAGAARGRPHMQR